MSADIWLKAIQNKAFTSINYRSSQGKGFSHFLAFDLISLPWLDYR